MTKVNKVFIATSLDGYIADADGGIAWLHDFPNPDNLDLGYSDFTLQIDALVMGRTTFETVCGFDVDWPYTKPVFVLSNTLTKVPEQYLDKVQLIKGDLKDVLNEIHQKGYHRLYVDGGKTIQSFLKEDLIDDMTITLIPTLLGNGIPLFTNLEKPLNFACVSTKIYLGSVVQNRFIRNR